MMNKKFVMLDTTFHFERFSGQCSNSDDLTRFWFKLRVKRTDRKFINDDKMSMEAAMADACHDDCTLVVLTIVQMVQLSIYYSGWGVVQ